MNNTEIKSEEKNCVYFLSREKKIKQTNKKYKQKNSDKTKDPRFVIFFALVPNRRFDRLIV
jgi:hypothetical protein